MNESSSNQLPQRPERERETHTQSCAKKVGSHTYPTPFNTFQWLHTTYPCSPQLFTPCAACLAPVKQTHAKISTSFKKSRRWLGNSKQTPRRMSYREIHRIIVSPFNMLTQSNSGNKTIQQFRQHMNVWSRIWDGGSVWVTVLSSSPCSSAVRFLLHTRPQSFPLIFLPLTFSSL